GDQYGVIKHLVDDLQSWGFELVMAGNIKGFLDRYANPTSIIPEADKRNLNYKMCTSYTDGTKLNIEMAILANVYGLAVPVPGMYGPPATHVNEVFQKFDFDHLWHDRKPFVDYILGAEPGGGVFAVGYCDHPYQQEMLAYYKMGTGPYYLFYRPYHLCHIEAISTIWEVVTRNTPFLQPDHGFQTNVYTYAKRNLKRGTALDGIGGYDCYGLIEDCTSQTMRPGLPICLAENVVLNRDFQRDEKICINDVTIAPDRFDFSLYEKALRVSSGKVPCT
ncbi:MAG: homoserine dehydrogenase, partial [Deltaproteobacteria bacterium]|nr:homoserine dehydrogenase [Deltaproteobacteria bacterium]